MTLAKFEPVQDAEIASQQMIEAMLKIGEKNRVYYVTPPGYLDMRIILFRKVLAEHNPDYAVALAPALYRVPHQKATFRIVSASLAPPLAIRPHNTKDVRVVVDHACILPEFSQVCAPWFAAKNMMGWV